MKPNLHSFLKIQEEQNVKMIAEIMQDEDMINNSRKKIAELSYKYKQLLIRYFHSFLWH